MKLDYRVSLSIDISGPTLKAISEAFFRVSALVLSDFFTTVLRGFAEQYMTATLKPFACERCGNRRQLIWKSREGRRRTKILTIFGLLTLPQLQVQCKRCGHKMYLTRRLLGVEPRRKVVEETARKLALMGALASFRVAQKIVGMFGWKLDRMTIWRSLQLVGRRLRFDLDEQQLPMGEADGTGIPIQGIRKRGKEMKVFVQLKRGGGVQVAGLAIGNYDGQWDKLFAPLRESFKKFRQFLLVTDGDSAILKGLGERVKVIVQRCLWHIPHQFKWVLWKDGVRRGSTPWVEAVTQLLDICTVRPLVDDEKVIRRMVDLKRQRLEQLTAQCRQQGWNHCATYLENAAPDMFTAILHRLEGRTTSLVERVMRTINLRINVGKWSMSGALNATKVRLAYYYNGFDA